MKYKMILTEEQYNHIAQCVEVVHRIACGQIESLNEILPNTVHESWLKAIKEDAFPELSYSASYKWDGGYCGTGHSEEFKKAFDKFQAQGYQIYREMLYQRYLAKGIRGVYSSPTLTTDKAKQPTIEVIKE